MNDIIHECEYMEKSLIRFLFDRKYNFENDNFENRVLF